MESTYLLNEFKESRFLQPTGKKKSKLTISYYLFRNIPHSIDYYNQIVYNFQICCNFDLMNYYKSISLYDIGVQMQTIKNPMPPSLTGMVIIHSHQVTIESWLTHYWQKLKLPDNELKLLAITQDRKEFMQWSAKQLNPKALGCYCYLRTTESSQHRHLIFIEPNLQPKSTEVTVAHELIHLLDRIKGTPRKHHHHGYDAIAIDEAIVTGYSLEDLRVLVHEESTKLEQLRRVRRPFRYIYICLNCQQKYPRTKKYSRVVSCSKCDKYYNPRFQLVLSSF